VFLEEPFVTFITKYVNTMHPKRLSLPDNAFISGFVGMVMLMAHIDTSRIWDTQKNPPAEQSLSI
jgi:hypothetical protein